MPLDAKAGELEAPNPRRSKGLTAFSAYLMMSIATLSWSGNIVATKIVMDDFPPQVLIPLRMWGATILFLLISPFSLRRRFERARGDWKTFAGLAITGLVLNQAFFMTGLWYSSVTHAALTFSMVPIFVLVISRWTHMEALTAPKILGETRLYRAGGRLDRRPGQGPGTPGGEPARGAGGLPAGCGRGPVRRVRQTAGPGRLEPPVLRAVAPRPHPGPGPRRRRLRDPGGGDLNEAPGAGPMAPKDRFC